MAKSQVVANMALKKLEDQLTCAICLDDFKDPKLLQCFHVYCKDCLQRLVVQDHQGQLSLSCPTCRQSTVLPKATGVSGLQSAFHVHHLLEIKDALEKVKEPQEIICAKCVKTRRQATSYCQDCGEFICELCTTTHSEWKEFSRHEVLSVDKLENKVKQLVSPKKVTLYCPHHEDMKLDLYCESCKQLICLHCTIKMHKDHQNDLVADTFKRHRSEITTALEPVDANLGLVNAAIEQIDTKSKDISNQQTVNRLEIERQVQELKDLLEARKNELIDQVDQNTQEKLKNLATQRDGLEAVQTQLASCLSFVRDSLKTDSQGEVMKMKNGVMEKIKEMTDNFNPDILPPCENANVKFTSSLPIQVSQLQQFGKVVLQQTSPEKCYATGKGLETAEPFERATAIVNVVGHRGEACPIPVESLSCELMSETTGEKKDCSVKKTGDSRYEISYQPASRGRHQLHIKVEGDHIKGSPFSVTVIRNFDTPIKTICNVRGPHGVAVTHNGEIVVAERNAHSVSIFSPTGEKLRSIGSNFEASKDGELTKPSGVVVEDDGNILVADSSTNSVQRFTRSGRVIGGVGKRGNHSLEFANPIGIALHPHNKTIHIVDNNNHRIQVLSRDMTFLHSFGGKLRSAGSKKQFYYPWDLTIDSSGKMYVADCSNHCIQVLSEDGKFQRRFGEKGGGPGQLCNPKSITIDRYNVIYVTEGGNHRVSVFTCEGKFLTSFGSQGSGPGQFEGPCGIAVDRNGVVYVSDTDNNRLQLF